MDFFNIPSELSKANSPAYKSGLLRLYRNGGCKDCNAKIGIGMYQNAGLAASRIMPMNPQQVQQIVKQNQEPQLTQDQRMRQAISGNINRRSNLSESTHTVQQQFTPKERANAIPQPSGLMQAADIVTDVMQLGNFVPHPAFQTIGRIGNYLGATVDGYQGMQNLVEGDYRNAAINFGGLALPTALELNSFKRNSKYIKPGQTLYPLSPQGLTKVNPGTIYFPPRTMYLEPFDQVRGMTKGNLLTNRAMLGTLGAETAYDSYGKGGEMIRRADGSYSRRGLWDNIRANRGSGKKPTKEMLKQERKIKAKYEGGAIIKDDRGQWAHPGKVTQINSPNITMKGVPYPVLGISDAGDTQMMMPNGEYQFSGNKVTEYPLFGKGGYTVRKTNERKGKTHVVIGPGGKKKYFGDPSMGERSKSKYGKEAFYKRHAKNLKSNPYFRAYARATWSDGGIMRDIEPFNLSSY